jgi:hypothetical protein
MVVRVGNPRRARALAERWRRALQQQIMRVGARRYVASVHVRWLRRSPAIATIRWPFLWLDAHGEPIWHDPILVEVTPPDGVETPPAVRWMREVPSSDEATVGRTQPFRGPVDHIWCGEARIALRRISALGDDAGPEALRAAFPEFRFAPARFLGQPVAQRRRDRAP